MKNNEAPQAIFLKDYQVPNYFIDKTELKFYLYEEHTLVRSCLQIRLNPESLNAASGDSQQLPNLVLNGIDLKLKSIQVNGAELAEDSYQVEKEHLQITPSHEQFELMLETEIKPQENTALEGLYVSKGMYCTQCEAHGFRRITYYLDRPDVMSVFDVYIEADQAQYPVLLSNGNSFEQGQLAGGRHWATWNDPHLKPCYLFALVAGDLDCVKSEFIRASGKPVSLELFVESHDIDKCDYAIESLKNAMRWDEEVFGREYDLDVYMIVAVNHFNMGAMENKGLNIFNTSCVLAHPSTTNDMGFERVKGVVAHEYFHNWSGNRVTCRDWFQLSLKEGFTVFRDEEFSSDMGSRTVKRIDDVNVLRNFQFKEDAGPMAHSVRPASYIEMNNFYTVTVYNKGAEVVRMLHTLLGAEDFRKACDYYFQTFDGHAATCDDFVSCMEHIAGKDFTQFKRWYVQAGTPVVEVSSQYNAEAKTFSLNLKQSCSPTPGQLDKLPFVIPVSVALFSSKGEKLNFDLNNEVNINETVLLLSDTEHNFIFENVQELALPSLLRNFSAPVKLQYAYEKQDLALLMSKDDDGFNAWDAGQNLFMQVLKALVESVQADETLQLDAELAKAVGSLLAQSELGLLDKAQLARMLSLPSQSYLAEQYEQIDVDAITCAHQFLEQEIANRFYASFKALYESNLSEAEYEPSAMQVAQRSLKNICLRYMSLSEIAENLETTLALAETQYKTASNMTDQGAAFRALVTSHLTEATSNSELGGSGLRNTILNHFYKTWQHEALVIDQWFSAQASGSRQSLLAEIQDLLTHKDFDFGNPNRVRALLGGVAQNYQLFHQADGSGYAFYAQQIKTLNAINPQIAARLVSALIHWKRYSGERGQLMKAQLEMLKALPDLSKDVFEIVNRGLA